MARIPKTYKHPGAPLMPIGEGDAIVARLIALEQEKRSLLAQWEQIQRNRKDLPIERIEKAPHQPHKGVRVKLEQLLD